MANGLERLYVIYVLVFMSSAFFGLSTAPITVEERTSGTIGELVLQIVTFVPVGFLILRHWRSFFLGLVDCKWALALLVLAFASGIWAADPLFVFRKSLILMANTAFGIYFGTRYTRDEQIELLYCMIIFIIVMSLLTIVLFPQYGIDHFTHFGAWRGVYSHKNVFGKTLVLGCLIFCLASRESLYSEILRFVGLAGCGVLIILSQSKTSAIAGSVLLGLISIYSALYSLHSRFRVQVMILTLLFLSTLIAVVIGYSDVLLPFLEQDETFTGRGPLWAAVLDAISRKPFLGYGFMSFWNGREGPSVSVVEALTGWVPPHSHNGFLDLWLELGIVGLLMFGISFVLRFRTAISEYQVLGSRVSLWPLGYLSMLLLCNLTENSLLRVNFLWWGLYVASLIRNVNCGRSCELRE